MAWAVKLKSPVPGKGGKTAYGVTVEDDQGVVRVTLVYDTQAEADTAADHIRAALSTATLVA